MIGHITSEDMDCKGLSERKLLVGHLTTEEFSLWQVVLQALSTHEQIPSPPTPILLQLLPPGSGSRRQAPCVLLQTGIQSTDSPPSTVGLALLLFPEAPLG